MPAAITFFSGAGGACAGLEQAGFKVIWGNEFYGPIADIWKANHPAARLDRRDILKIHPRTIPKADLYWFSPPCPEFSSAKRNRSGGTDREDTAIAQKIAAIILSNKPKSVVIENVPGYKRSKSLPIIYSALAAIGHEWQANVMNSADWGTPQTRIRLIIRASARVSPLLPTHDAKQWQQLPLFGDRLLPWVGWQQAIADILSTLPETYLSENQKTAIRSLGVAPQNLLVQRTGYYNQRGPTIRSAQQPSWTITASQSSDSKENKNGLPSWRSPATIVQGDRILQINRPCLARFQGFPDSHIWGESEAINCRAIGNAVPVQLARAVGISFGRLTNQKEQSSRVAHLP